MDISFTPSTSRAFILTETSILLGVWLSSSTLVGPAFFGLRFIPLSLLGGIKFQLSLFSSSLFSFLTSIGPFDKCLTDPISLF